MLFDELERVDRLVLGLRGRRFVVVLGGVEREFGLVVGVVVCLLVFACVCDGL